MRRIECENDDCDQTLTVEDRQCDRCGRRQATRRWTAVVLGLYYPLISALIGFIAFLFLGMAAPAALSDAGPLPVAGIIAAVYLVFAARTVRDYLRRQRRIRESESTTEAFFDDLLP
jgi:membrane protein implicated in regulation of membrane protease activity